MPRVTDEDGSEKIVEKLHFSGTFSLNLVL
jgi:hypothetical protein